MALIAKTREAMKYRKRRLGWWRSGLTRWLVARSGKFDAAFYLKEYPDVAAAGIAPLKHYCDNGWRESRRPGPDVHPGALAAGPAGRSFARHNPVAVWMVLGRWLGWSLAWPQVREWRGKETAGADIAIVLHETTRTGAPIFALRLARWLRRTGRAKPVFVLLGEGAALPQVLSEFACVPLFAMDHGVRAQVLRSALPASCVLYLNSLATLREWDAFDQAGAGRRGIVLHAHESAASLPAYASGIAAVRPAHPFVIAVNEACREPLAALLGTAPEIVPPAIELPEDVPYPQAVRSTHVIVGCGTMSRRKGADLFCHVAAQLVRDHGRKVEFLWLGGDGDVDMRALVRQLGLADRVRLPGEVADPLPLLAEATVMLLTSRDDPFPLVALEAASCGVPVVCFDALADGVGTWISGSSGQGVGGQGEAGAVVPSFDVGAMAKAVSGLLDDAVRCRQAGTAARSAAARFDIELLGPRIAAVINAAKGGGTGRAVPMVVTGEL